MSVTALYERMRADQRKFGKSAWTAAVERMERLQYAVSKETLQLMRAKEICLEQRKHGLKEEVKHNMLVLLEKTNHRCGPGSGIHCQILKLIWVCSEKFMMHHLETTKTRLGYRRAKRSEKPEIIAVLEK